MSELVKRTAFALPAGLLFLYITWTGEWPFTAMVIGIALFIQYEMSHICKKAGFKPDTFFPYTIALWILLIPFLPFAFELGLAIFLLFSAVQVFKKSDYAMQEFVSTFFCSLYAPLGLLGLTLIRSTGASEAGLSLTIALLLMVWGNDICAYLGGKYLGNHLLAPKISPKKTWEGFLFGVAGAVLGLFLAMYAFPLPFPTSVLAALPLVAVVSIFGPLGDLAESRLKRAAGVKDASNILPGHGGLLDRFDALILAAPAFYLYVRWLEHAGLLLL